jgi:hypothetical protein
MDSRESTAPFLDGNKQGRCKRQIGHESGGENGGGPRARRSGLSFSVPSTASCAAPTISLSPASGKPGTQITVSGQGWVSGCDDTGGGGCFGSTQEEAEPSHPYKDVTLAFVGPLTKKLERELRTDGTTTSAARSVKVGEADADAQGIFTVAVAVPDLPPSRYLVTSDFGDVEIFKIKR